MVDEEHARLNKELGITSDTKATNNPVVSTKIEGATGLKKSTQSLAKKQGTADVPIQGAGAIQKKGSVQQQGKKSGQKQGMGAVPKQRSAVMQKSSKK